jgi:hypothetical protein
MNSIQQMIEEFKSDNNKKKINSLRYLPSIALSLGPERTKSELIPFLNAGNITIRFLKIHTMRNSIKNFLKKKNLKIFKFIN